MVKLNIYRCQIGFRLCWLFAYFSICATAIISSYQSVKLEKITTEQTKEIEKLHIEFDALHLSYQEKHSQLSDRISRFDEKSQIMADMLSSLPEAHQQEFNDKTAETDNEQSK